MGEPLCWEHDGRGFCPGSRDGCCVLAPGAELAHSTGTSFRRGQGLGLSRALGEGLVRGGGGYPIREEKDDKEMSVLGRIVKKWRTKAFLTRRIRDTESSFSSVPS